MDHNTCKSSTAVSSNVSYVINLLVLAVSLKEASGISQEFCLRFFTPVHSFDLMAASSIYFMVAASINFMAASSIYFMAASAHAHQYSAVSSTVRDITARGM